MVPLADVLPGSLLEEALVVRDTIFAVDEARRKLQLADVRTLLVDGMR